MVDFDALLPSSVVSMGDAELDFSNAEMLLGEEQSSSMDSLLSAGFLNECLRDTQHQHACSHLHTCNPPGPDHSHTHTCLHVHTKIVPAPNADSTDTADSTDKIPTAELPPPQVDNDSAALKKVSKGKGNCEAVRKYRLKKKARAASLEEEVAQLREINQQLMKRLQGQAALEAEVARLRCLLVDIRGRIEGEIGSFPYQKPARVGGELVGNMVPMNVMSGAQFVNSCNFGCDEHVQCLQPGMQGRGGGQSNGQGFGACGIGNVQCMGSFSTGMEFLDCGRGNMMPAGCSSNGNKIKGSHAATEG